MLLVNNGKEQTFLFLKEGMGSYQGKFGSKTDINNQGKTPKPAAPCPTSGALVEINCDPKIWGTTPPVLPSVTHIVFLMNWLYAVLATFVSRCPMILAFQPTPLSLHCNLGFTFKKFKHSRPSNDAAHIERESFHLI